MKTVDQMFSSSDFTYSQKKSNLAAVKAEETKPKYLFIFIDEINRHCQILPIQYLKV
jgi:hypothetical protein